MPVKKEITYKFESFIEERLGLKEHQAIYCTAYQENKCFTKMCKYSHVKLAKAVVCKHWLRGLCKKHKKCEYLHEYDLKKMPECWFFSKYGECSNIDCNFIHIDPNSSSKECLWYKRGFCRHGAECRGKHVKRKICHDYMFGFCIKGLSCEKGHPKFETPDGSMGQPGWGTRHVRETDIIDIHKRKKFINK